MNEFIRSLHREFPDDAVPHRHEGYSVKKIPCCYLLSNPDRKHVLKLTETSLLVLELCNGSFNVGEILDFLVSQYPEAASTIKRDVFRVLDEFSEENVITVRTTGYSE
ncbi:PqqD family protein [Pseudomonadota bacterium]